MTGHGLGQGGAEAAEPVGDGGERTRPGEHREVAVAEGEQGTGECGRALAVLRLGGVDAQGAVAAEDGATGDRREGDLRPPRDVLQRDVRTEYQKALSECAS
jgi:hypothetical protein